MAGLISKARTVDNSNKRAMATWMVGLTVGQGLPTKATPGCWFRFGSASVCLRVDKTVLIRDAELAWEASLKFQVTDNITDDSGNLLSA